MDRRLGALGIGFARACCLVGPLLLCTTAGAQLQLPGRNGEKAATETPPPAVTPESIETRRIELTRQIAELRAALALGGEREADPTLLQRVERLERLDRTLTRHAEALGNLAAARQAGEIGDSGMIDAEPPYPLALYDAVGETLDAHLTRARLLEQRVEDVREEVTRLAGEHEDLERQRRLLREALAAITDPVERTEQTQRLNETELDSQFAQARLARARTDFELAGLEVQRQKQQTQLLESTLAHVRSRLRVTRDALDEPLGRVDLELAETRSELEQVKRSLASSERRLTDAQQRADRLPTPTPVLAAELRARQAQRETAEWRVSALDARVQRLEGRRKYWERRVEVLNGRATRLESSQWLTEVENDLDQLRRTERFIEGRRSEFLQDLEALRGGAEPTDPEAVAWREERMAAMATLTQEYERARDQIVQERQFLRHLQRELRAETTALDPIGRLRSLLTRLRESLDREVFVVDDRPISVGKLLVAFVLFAVSISLSRVLARGIGRLLYRRLLEPGAAEAFQSLTFYGLLVAFFLFALRTVNIPLTAFALLGGALAIGLGFGSQNVIGNFISGLILLVERPIKVNDIVEVDGVNGIVERVGPRSTRIRTFDNLHIIVPNSAFLDRNVVNWTLSDQVVRRSILVGVGYDSSPRDVQRLVLRALEEHGVVLRNPPPKVLLGDFGADSLVFRAYFWLRLEPNVSFLDIESDLRRRILQLFREAGIVISFPQRDVHFDAAQPIAVRVLPQPPEEPKAG